MNKVNLIIAGWIINFMASTVTVVGSLIAYLYVSGGKF